MEIKIYTDGACIGNPGPGGWAAVILTENDKKELFGGERLTTNNRMELTAAIKALEYCNNNEEKVYISSADWMTRNIENRVEVTCPIYDESIKNQLIDIYDICWRDNQKARILNASGNNSYKKIGKQNHRSQFETYNYLKDFLNKNE